MATTNFCTLATYNFFKKRYPDTPGIELVIDPASNEPICQLPKSLQPALEIFVESFALGYETCQEDIKQRIAEIKKDTESLEQGVKDKIAQLNQLKITSVDLQKKLDCNTSLLKEAYNKMEGAYQRGYNDAYQSAYRLGQGMGVKLVESEARKWKQSYLDLQKEFDGKITEAKNESYVFGVEAGRNAELAEAIIPSDAYNIEVFAVKPADDGIGLQAFVGFQFKFQGTEQFRFTQVKYSVTNPSNKYDNNCQKIENKSNCNIN